MAEEEVSCGLPVGVYAYVRRLELLGCYLRVVKEEDGIYRAAFSGMVLHHAIRARHPNMVTAVLLAARASIPVAEKTYRDEEWSPPLEVRYMRIYG